MEIDDETTETNYENISKTSGDIDNIVILCEALKKLFKPEYKEIEDLSSISDEDKKYMVDIYEKLLKLKHATGGYNIDTMDLDNIKISDRTLKNFNFTNYSFAGSVFSFCKFAI